MLERRGAGLLADSLTKDKGHTAPSSMISRDHLIRSGESFFYGELVLTW